MAPRPPMAPLITCQDIDKTYEYFTRVLGFAGQGKIPGPDGATMHASVSYPTRHGEGHLMFSSYARASTNPQTGAFGQRLKENPHTLGNGVILFFDTPNVDKYHAFLQTTGAVIDEPPTDQMWGDRTISVLTPDGYYLTFGTPIKGHEGMKQMAAMITDVVDASAPGLRKAAKPARKAAPAKRGPAKGKAKSGVRAKAKKGKR